MSLKLRKKTQKRHGWPWIYSKLGQKDAHFGQFESPVGLSLKCLCLLHMRNRGQKDIVVWLGSTTGDYVFEMVHLQLTFISKRGQKDIVSKRCENAPKKTYSGYTGGEKDYVF